ncbi:uncharacterized protein EDB91DRAFT_154600 [Suillus paluster]|uniref:uncharacterized protein n=1 Tax=Suillus paluster TaxID=48578 RepID=UPI001B87543B|nr:uncharacterized protein EDB91DRAFT_154600 [Suillus paluster]KAG1723973.1 hypothetical protein EDB91DRAFT_154600 [Suillus paluster]
MSLPPKPHCLLWLMRCVPWHVWPACSCRAAVYRVKTFTAITPRPRLHLRLPLYLLYKYCPGHQVNRVKGPDAGGRFSSVPNGVRLEVRVVRGIEDLPVRYVFELPVVCTLEPLSAMHELEYRYRTRAAWRWFMYNIAGKRVTACGADALGGYSRRFCLGVCLQH